jgi:hypothetical protein
MLSAIKALILVLIIGVVIYKISFIETREYTTNFSQFVSLRGVDEYVVNELRTNENFHRESEKILWHDIPIGRAVTDISLIASFKYFVKLRELKYEIESDTLVVNVPSLYLSTPVAYDSATVKNNCNASTPFVDCKSTINILMSEVTGKIKPIFGNALWLEYEDLLGRDVWTDATSDDERRQVLSALIKMGRWVTVYYGWRPNLPDEADIHLVE